MKQDFQTKSKFYIFLKKYVNLTKPLRLDLNNLRAYYLAYNFIEDEHIFFISSYFM